MTAQAEKLRDEMLMGGDMTPQFLNEQEEALFAQFMLGEEAIKFLNSDLGKVMRGMAMQRLQDCKNEMIHVRPWTPWGRRKIQKLQFDAAVAEQFLEFLRELLISGENASEQLKHTRVSE